MQTLNLVLMVTLRAATAVIGLVLAIAPPVRAEDSGASSAPNVAADASLQPWTLRVRDGDIYRGQIQPAESRNHLRWKSPSFSNCVDFDWNMVERIERTRLASGSSSTMQQLTGNLFCVEFHNGICLSGELRSLNGSSLLMSCMGLGDVEIPVERVRSLLRIGATSLDAVQVFNPGQWEQVLPAPKNGRATKWFLKAGEIATDTSGTTISQWATMPALATIDIDVAWEQPTVNWWLTIGEPRRMELQVRKLQNKNLLNITLLVENSKDADVATVQIPYPASPNLSLKLLCDANKGNYVLMHEDRVLGRIKGNTTERIVGRNKFSFTNTALGVLSLRDLRITDRPFTVPADSSDSGESMTEVMTRSRGTFMGALTSEGAERGFQVRSSNDAITAIDFDELERIEFPPPAAPTEADTAMSITRIELLNGLRFCTSSVNSQPSSESLHKSPPGIAAIYESSSIQIPWDSIDRIVALRPSKSEDAPAQTSNARTMKLTTEDVVSVGSIVDVFKNESGANSLIWKPRHAVDGSPIAPHADGLIEPVNLAPVASPKKAGATPPPMSTVRNDNVRVETEVARELRPNDPSIFLINGDCFPGKVLAADEEKVRFDSSLFEQKELPANEVRGVRIVDFNGVEAMDRATKARLLTLPRMLRKNPPTHLIVARDGDVLRGRLLAFDRDQVRVEVRAEERVLAMKDIAEIIWLEKAPKPSTSADQESPTTDPEPPTTTDPPAETAQGGGVYQVLLQQGARVSIVPGAINEEAISGNHPHLGPCRLPWDSITRVFLGKAIRLDASRNRYGKWKLQNAPDPKFVNEGEEPGNDAPNDTAHDRLVGQPAPEFDLPRLDGTPFRIADYRGKVLILDFWATWCGPCIQSMPRIHQLSRQYHDVGVEAVFVNLEEPEDRIRTLLERLEIMPTVALDSDGAFSRQYAVQAIPQTVVIDREGNIAKVLVGAGEESENELTRFLNELTSR